MTILGTEMQPDCVFCKIIKGEIAAEFVKKTDNFVVFADAHPTAPLHLLIVPKTHVSDIASVNGQMWNEIRQIALDLAEEKKVDGFELAVNYGSRAEIKHLHVHFKR